MAEDTQARALASAALGTASQLSSSIAHSLLTDNIKDALLDCFAHVEWTDEHGQDYYNALEAALYPPAELVSITAVYTQSGIVNKGASLNTLKADLVVTAYYDDGTSAAVNDYTLSGSLDSAVSTITVTYGAKTATFTVNVNMDVDSVDICLFCGQSNMDGRGEAEEATEVGEGEAYKWDTSTNAVVDFTAEGSMIPAYVKRYYDLTGVPIVEVKRAIGGVTISEFVDTYLSLATANLTSCKAWLEANGKTVRRVFMLWNQGESDAGVTTAEDYTEDFDAIRTSCKAVGVNQFFIVNIGQTKDGYADFTEMRETLENLCNDTDTFMVSEKFYNGLDYMQDRWHYVQLAYNIVGADAAMHTVEYFNDGEISTLIPLNSADILGVPTEYGTLTDFDYTLQSTRVLLNQYGGTDENVRVYRQYKLGNMYYEARLKRSTGSADNVATFYGCTSIKHITIDDGVKIGFNDIQVLNKMFHGCSALLSVDGLPEYHGIYYAFYNCSNFAQPIGLTGLTYDNTRGMYGTAITAIGDVSTTANSLQGVFQNCIKLETVGTISGDSVTKIGNLFINCSSLTGNVRIECPNIDNADSAFTGCDFTKFKVQCPANSTTYDTLSTAYPDLVIETF